MLKLIECIPNFSEGKDPQIIQAIAQSILQVEGTLLLDVDSNENANRTVYTMVGPPESIEESAFRAIRTAGELIDMAQQKGVHPRSGATDVCPFVPLGKVKMEECAALARRLAERVGKELRIPSYLYGYAAFDSWKENLASCRKGEYEGIKQKIQEEKWKPDFGPCEWNQKSGLTNIGARDFLIAYNLNLNTKDTKIAKKIAAAVRESGVKSQKIPGKLKAVKAIGWYIEEFGFAQVSTNLVDYRVTPLHLLYETASREAEKWGVQVTGSELIGMIPEEALLTAGKYFSKEAQTTMETLQCAVHYLGLDQIRPFCLEKRVLELAIKQQKVDTSS